MAMLRFMLTVTGAALPCAWRAGAYEKVVAQSAARTLEKKVREHLDARGGRAYWHEAAMNTTAAPAPEGGLVRIRKLGVALHFYGGTVRPTGRISRVTGKPIKRLLVPGKESPLRRTGSELEKLGIAPEAMRVASKGGRAWLLADDGAGGTMFLGTLAASVTHRPDRTVLPPDKDMADAMGEGAAAALRLLKL